MWRENGPQTAPGAYLLSAVLQKAPQSSSHPLFIKQTSLAAVSWEKCIQASRAGDEKCLVLTVDDGATKCWRNMLTLVAFLIPNLNMVRKYCIARVERWFFPLDDFVFSAN
jgi:hypothetical protein